MSLVEMNEMLALKKNLVEDERNIAEQSSEDRPPLVEITDNIF